MVATSPLASGQLTSKIAEFFIVWTEGWSAAFLAFVLCNPRLHQLLQKSRWERLIRCEADGAFRCLEVLQFVLELYGWPSTREQAAMVREGGEAREHSFVFERRDAIADAL